MLFLADLVVDVVGICRYVTMFFVAVVADVFEI